MTIYWSLVTCELVRCQRCNTSMVKEISTVKVLQISFPNRGWRQDLLQLSNEKTDRFGCLSMESKYKKLSENEITSRRIGGSDNISRIGEGELIDARCSAMESIPGSMPAQRTAWCTGFDCTLVRWLLISGETRSIAWMLALEGGRTCRFPSNSVSDIPVLRFHLRGMQRTVWKIIYRFDLLSITSFPKSPSMFQLMVGFTAANFMDKNCSTMNEKKENAGTHLTTLSDSNGVSRHRSNPRFYERKRTVRRTNHRT